MYGRFKAVIIAAVLIVLINAIFLWNINSHNIKGDGILKIINTSKNELGLTVYHHDPKNRFVVMELQKDPLQEGKQYSSEGDFLKLTSKGAPYDIQYILSHDNAAQLNFVEKQMEKNFEATGLERIELESSFRKRFKQFFEDLLNVIDESKPKIPSINNDDHYRIAKDSNSFPNRDGRVMLYGGNLRENYLQEPVRTKAMLSNYLRLSENELDDLKRSHHHFFENMPRGFPPELLQLSKFNKFMKGDGIVILGGDRYNQLALLSVKVLRSHGSKLPVEVIMPHRSDFDAEFCVNILPSFDATCKIMADYLPDSLLGKIKGYQYKNVAIMISSFKRVLFLDADNLVLKNPDVLFANEPFTSHHLVLWPDFWRRSTSPNFYEIADIEVDEKSKIRNSYFPGDARGTTKDLSHFSFHDCKGAIPEASSETGQILINKEVHNTTLILSMYYNWFGPDFYYPLLSQGAAGEGDKETFITAAHKLNLPLYQVKEFNREFGPVNERGGHELYAMGQYDPIIDYIQSRNNEDESRIDYHYPEKPTYAQSDTDSTKNNYNYHLYKSSSLLFLHANWPKFYLHEMFILNSYGRGPLVDEKRRRLYNTELKKELGYDLELNLNKELKWCYCDLRIGLQHVPDPNGEERKTICNNIKNQISFLEGAD
ncbi:uncharacterized protein PRCAT00004065001 [Priceomyces carsonii]|uniref:uncharacterized protein n=1 Tax=Priceomyces carsonii TaxID=28549 RepID=UPI002ED9598A|nr:unnamed protein product [Priceomyces carsonii]